MGVFYPEGLLEKVAVLPLVPLALRIQGLLEIKDTHCPRALR